MKRALLLSVLFFFVGLAVGEWYTRPSTWEVDFLRVWSGL